MKCVEYGKEHKEVIILLHGGGLSWWNYKEVAELLQKDFHVIIPILDGHAGIEEQFVSIEENAKKIITYIEKQCGGSVLLIGGLSLGGQVLVEILSQREKICNYALIESALVVPMKLTHMMINPVFGISYGLVKHRWFSKLQFKSLRIKETLYNSYYTDTCKITKSNMISFLEANSKYAMKKSLQNTRTKVFVYVGEKENRKMLISAKKIQESIPESKLEILKGLYHGEFSINHSGTYVDRVKHILESKNN